MLVTAIHHLPQEAMASTRPDYHIQGLYTGLLDVAPNLFFLPPTRRGLRGHPYKIVQGTSHRWRRGSAFSVRVVLYWNASSAIQLLLSIFKKELEKVWTDVFLHLPHCLDTNLSNLPPSICIPSINSHLYMAPAPCSVYVVSAGPLGPSYYH